MLVATAGHVDHGKTTLINALTGVDTDRLPEEKKRGLTIELGFAYLTDPDASGVTLGFIDVPGHEKFIRNMVAGVGAIDVALLVVAADDGVMPQTREHIAILNLMGIGNCVLAISRVDLATDREVASVEAQTRQVLSDYGLTVAACVPVCAPQNQGVQLISDTLFAIAREQTPTRLDANFRLAIDRCFSVRGAGTVITGAVFSGCINTGDTVRLLPSRLTARVREIHANGSAAVGAQAGQRAALNLGNIERSKIERGAWAVSSQVDVVSNCIDVRLRLLQTEKRSFRHWTPVHLHTATQAVTGRLALYSERSIEPGGNAYAQFLSDKPLHMLFADRFILRDQTARRTLGGGYVVDPFSSRLRSFRKNRLGVLQALDNQDTAAALLKALDASPAGLMTDTIQDGRNLLPESYAALLQSTQVGQYTDQSGGVRLITYAKERSAKEKVLAELTQYHFTEPQQAGPEVVLLRQLCELPFSLFNYIVDSLIRSGDIQRNGARVRKPGHRVQLIAEDQALLEKILALVNPDCLKPPPLTELAVELGMDRDALLQRVDVLAASGQIVQVAKNRLFHPDALSSLADLVRELAGSESPEGFTAKVFRDRSQIGRNLSIDVLEFFDRSGLTIRIGDKRRLKPEHN